MPILAILHRVIKVFAPKKDIGLCAICSGFATLSIKIFACERVGSSRPYQHLNFDFNPSSPGQPPTIADENCDLTLPPGYTERAFMDPESEDSTNVEPIFPFDLRLSVIKSRAHSTLYSVSSLKKSDAELLKSIRELDDELEKWRAAVPAHWRPTMSFAQDASDPNVSMHSVMLRMNYYLCMSIIHQASSRCKSWVNGSGGLVDGISSSLTLSVEASRSTLCYLESAEHVLVDGVFWYVFNSPCELQWGATS